MPSLTLQDFVYSVLERLVFYGRSKGITSGTKQVSSYLPRFWVGVDEYTDGDT